MVVMVGFGVAVRFGVIGAVEGPLVRVEGGTRCRAHAEPGLPRARLRRPRTCRGRRACWTWRSAGAGPARHPRATRDRAGSPSAPGDPEHLLEVLARLGQVLPDRGRVSAELAGNLRGTVAVDAPGHHLALLGREGGQRGQDGAGLVP